MKVVKRKNAYCQYEDGTWGIDTKIKVDGKFYHLSKKGYPTLSSAKADYDNVRANFITSKGVIINKDYLIEDLVNEYLKMRKVAINYTTLSNDIYLINKYIYKYYKNYKLIDIFKKENIRIWYNNIIREPLSSGRKSKVIAKMKELLKLAYSHKYIDAEVFQDCDVCLYPVKVMKAPKVERVVWSKEEEDKFWEEVKNTNERDYVMFKLFFNSTCRIGEFMGLQGKCVNLDSGKIKIYQQSIYVNGEGLKLTNRLKTNESYRIIALPKSVNEMLKDYMTTMGIGDEDFLFVGRDSNLPISRTTFRRKLTEYCENAGIRVINPHASRHLQATKLARVCKNGEDIEASARRLGHSPEMFLNTYAKHISEETENKLLEQIGEL